MEKQTNIEFVYQNLVTCKKYAEIYGVAEKTVHEWVKLGKLTKIEFLEKMWLDKTVPAPRTYNLTKKQVLTAKHL